MLRFSKIDFKYEDNVIFYNFSHQFISKKIHALVGPSGCGKTTLLKLIAGILNPQKGKIDIKGERVSYIFQDVRLIEELTIFKNLDFILKAVYPNKETRSLIIMAGLKDVGIGNVANLYPHQLSWGMTKRIALLRAFLFPSKYLLMDEPFSGLDLNIKHTLMQLFIKLWNKNRPTVILVSHDLDECLLLANTINLINKKPIKINDHFLIKTSHTKRDLTSKESITIKKVLLQKIKLW